MRQFEAETTFVPMVEEDIRLRLPCREEEISWNMLRELRDVAQHVGLKPLIQESEAWPRLGFGMLVIEDVSSEAFVGVAGLAEPFRCDGPHLVCAVLPQWRGRCSDGRESRALRACRRLLRWADTRSLVVYAHVDADNQSGLRLVDLLGGIPVMPTMSGAIVGASRADFVFAENRQ